MQFEFRLIFHPYNSQRLIHRVLTQSEQENNRGGGLHTIIPSPFHVCQNIAMCTVSVGKNFIHQKLFHQIKDTDTVLIRFRIIVYHNYGIQ